MTVLGDLMQSWKLQPGMQGTGLTSWTPSPAGVFFLAGVGGGLTTAASGLFLALCSKVTSTSAQGIICGIGDSNQSWLP